jgi:SAM-dependent methyltransferase
MRSRSLGARRVPGDARLLTRGAGLLRCPEHPDPLEVAGDALACPAGDLRLEPRDGALIVADDEPHHPETRALRLMHSPFVARIYEDRWRPALVGLVAGFGYATEDAVVDRHVAAEPGLRVLDLCSGTARAGRRWLGRGAEVLAVDESREMLGEARRRCPDDALVLVQADARRGLPRARTFDAALCLAALHLLDDPDALLAATAEALRPGGVFVAWVLIAGGRLAPGFVPPGLARRLGLRLFARGELPARTVGAGLETVESFVDGAVEFVVARRGG